MLLLLVFFPFFHLFILFVVVIVSFLCYCLIDTSNIRGVFHYSFKISHFLKFSVVVFFLFCFIRIVFSPPLSRSFSLSRSLALFSGLLRRFASFIQLLSCARLCTSVYVFFLTICFVDCCLQITMKYF